MPPYTTKDLYKTKLCVLFQRGGCPRTSCTFAHGEDELRRLNVGGGESRRDPDSGRYKPHDRDYRGSPSSRRRSPSEDYSRSPSRRGRSADRGGGRKRAHSDSISRSHSDRNKRHRDSDRDYSDESPRSRRSYSPPPRSNNYELEKEVASLQDGNRALETKLALLQEKLDIREHASDDLKNRTAELESRLAGADENLRRANSQLRKLAKAHLKASQASEDVRRYKAKLDRLASDIINEEAPQADYRAKSVLSDEDPTSSLLRSTQKAGGSSRQRSSPPSPLPAEEEPLPALPAAYHSGSEGDPGPTAAAANKPKRDVRERTPSPVAERSKVFREDKAVPKPKRGHLRKREEYSSPSSCEEKEPRNARSPSKSQERQRHGGEAKLRKEARASQARAEDEQQPAGGLVAKLPQKLVVPGSDLQVKGKNSDPSPRRRRRGRDRRSSPDEDDRWKGDMSTGEPPYDRRQRRSSPDDRWGIEMSLEDIERKRRAHSPYERPGKEESPVVQKKDSREVLPVAVEGRKGGGQASAAEDMQVEPAGAEGQQPVVKGVPGEGQTMPVKSWPEEADAKQGASAFSFKIQPAKANLANPRVEPRRKPQQDNNRRPITIGSNPPIHQALLARTPAVPTVSVTSTAVSAQNSAAPVPAVAPVPKVLAAVVAPIPPVVKTPLRPLLPPLPAQPNYHPDEPPPPGCGTDSPLLGNGGVDMFNAGFRATVVRAKYGEENDDDIDVEA